MAAGGHELTDITLEDLQEKHRQIAECVGVEGLLNLIDMFGGNSIYIPQLREAVKLKVYQMIEDEFDGTNIKALSTKYDVSESTVYKIVREKLRAGTFRRRHPVIPGQISVADWIENL